MAKKNQTITIQLTGSSKDGGDVRLDEFLHELDALRLALKHAERKASGNIGSKVYYKIVKLSHNSPASITLEAVSTDGQEIRMQTLSTFFSDLKYIRKKQTVPPNSDFQTIQAYRGLVAMREKNIEKIMIRNGSSKIAIDEKFQKNIEKAIGPDEVEVGGLFGKLEVINLHKIPHFVIYPTIGPAKIDCSFGEELRDTIIKAIDRRVEVAGEIRFKSWDKYPYAMRVREVRILDDKEIPHLIDIKGIAPNATGEMSSVEFLRKVRSEAGQANILLG